MGILKALRWLLRGWEEHGGQAFFLLRPFSQVGGEEARERQAASASVTPIPIPADSALFVYFLGISKSYPRLGRHPALFRENYFPTLFGRCFLPEQFWLSDGCLFQETAGGTSAGPLPAGWPAGISLGPRARPRQPCTHSCTHAHGAWTQACPTGCLSLPPPPPAASPRTPAPQCGTLFGFPKKQHWEKENFGETLHPEDYATYSLST